MKQCLADGWINMFDNDCTAHMQYAIRIHSTMQIQLN